MPIPILLVAVLFAGCHGSSSGGTVPDALPMSRDAEASKRDGDAPPGPRDAAVRDGEASTPTPPLKPPAHTFVYIGGWSNCGASYPFRAFSLDRTTGALTVLGDADLGRQPSMIARSRDGRFLYVGNECGGAEGGVTVASINRDTGALTRLDHESADGADVVFTSLAPGATHVLAASYGGGRAFVFPIEGDGTLSAFSDSISFGGAAQTHSIRVHPSGRWAFAPNKNLDQIAQLTFDAATSTLSAQSVAALETANGAGPRHIAFTPKGDYAYVMNELNSTVSAYAISDTGQLSELESESSLPAGFLGTNTGAHVLVSPNGRYVYASNRGHNSIAVFAIQADGTLDLVEHESTRGSTPRHFDIDDRGEWLIVANQDGSGSLAAFRIGKTGSLEALGDGVTGLSSPNAVAIVNVD